MSPSASLRPCGQPGCSKLVARGRCSEHSRSPYTKSRQSSSKMYGRRWQKVRLMVLHSNPLCVHCKQAGRLTPASQVDHIRTIKDYPEGQYEIENMRALCHSCHSRRTAKDHGFARSTK